MHHEPPDFHVEGLEASGYHGTVPEEAERICKHLRPWIAHSCTIFVLTDCWYPIGVEDSINSIMNPQIAARA